MKCLLLFSIMLLQLSVSATTRVFWITSSGVVDPVPGSIHLGDTLVWANMSSYTYSVSGRMSPSGDYPFTCDGIGSCKYVPAEIGHYTYGCYSPDYVSFSGSFTVTDPTNIIKTPTQPALFTCTPNPAKDQLHFTGTGKCLVSLYNLLGNNVAQFSFFSTGLMYISALPAGTYFASAIIDNQHTTQKIIISK